MKQNKIRNDAEHLASPSPKASEPTGDNAMSDNTETKQYTVKEPVTVDGQEHLAGETLDLTADQFASLPKGSVTEVSAE